MGFKFNPTTSQLDLVGGGSSSTVSHVDLTNKNDEADVQHLTAAEKAKALTDYLQVVTTDSSLSGSGTVASPLTVVKVTITELNKTANYSNYATTSNDFKYTFNRTGNIITSVTKEEV